VPPINLVDGEDSAAGDKPALPPRTDSDLGTGRVQSAGRKQTPAKNLLDDEPGEELEALRGWEVLRPVL
jgi:hypothetical protein